MNRFCLNPSRPRRPPTVRGGPWGTPLFAVLGLLGCQTASGGEQGASSDTTAPFGRAPAIVEPDAPLTWPVLLPEEVDVPALDPSEPIVVYLDAGHGAKDNSGNTSCFCIQEQTFTASLAHDVREDLHALGGFEVVLSRPTEALVQYADRVEAARRAGADAFVSLHSDIRGKPEEWQPEGSAICRRSEAAPGFSVLYSDEGGTPLVESRKRLADSIASALLEAKFIPYRGAEYVDLYEPIPSENGVFVDRHEDRKRIFILRRTVMPTVIVETHNALDPREALAFEDPIVRRAFSLALAKGIATAVLD